MARSNAERQRKHQRKLLLERADLWEFKARRTTERDLAALWMGKAEKLRRQADISAARELLR